MFILKVVSNELNQLCFITPEGKHYYPYNTVDEMYEVIRGIYSFNVAYSMEWNANGDELVIRSAEEEDEYQMAQFKSRRI